MADFLPVLGCSHESKEIRPNFGAPGFATAVCFPQHWNNVIPPRCRSERRSADALHHGTCLPRTRYASGNRPLGAVAALISGPVGTNMTACRHCDPPPGLTARVEVPRSSIGRNTGQLA